MTLRLSNTNNVTIVELKQKYKNLIKDHQLNSSSLTEEQRLLHQQVTDAFKVLKLHISQKEKTTFKANEQLSIEYKINDFNPIEKRQIIIE